MNSLYDQSKKAFCSPQYHVHQVNLFEIIITLFYIFQTIAYKSFRLLYNRSYL